ncbi:DUF7835 family putative zinc beta-ribbon protein [Halobacterium rubrum]|uniref:DUF7835 family putative zinc beta-ribbon protein n=1 Tax=Halobacterium TaxID=2239 RepID=UPI001F425F66|nr:MULTISPECIES: hypothetical protein [Halobacterium]MDH5019360.1 hypothetical protein [Halobacterium rubrum]
MASKTPQTDGLTERCENCSSQTTHRVSVELRTENEGGENAAFSREPYRVATCRACGEETSQRMNDA